MSLPVSRVKYAEGYGGTYTAAVFARGLPVQRGPIIPFQKVIAGQGAPAVTSPTMGPVDDYWDAGSYYWTASIPMVWSPSRCVHFLDSLFYLTTPGGSPTYTRNYYLDSISQVPTNYMTFLKWVAKANNDVITYLKGGVPRGFSMTLRAGDLMRFTAEAAFGNMADGVSGLTDSASWAMASTGDCEPWLASTTTIYAMPAGDAPVLVSAWSEFSLTLSCPVEPEFWAEQTPHRITRGEPVVTGEIALRDSDDEVEVWDAWAKAGTTVALMLVDGSGQTIYLNTKLTGGGDGDNSVARTARYSWRAVDTETGSYKFPFWLSVQPDKAS